MAAGITQNINYNYRTNVQTLTLRHERWDATMNRNVVTTKKLTRAIGTKDKYFRASEKIAYKNAKATNQFGVAMGKTGKSSKRLGQGMGGLALRFVGYQMILTQVMGAQQKLIDFIKQSVTAYREFETRLAEISTILGSEQIPMMARLQSGIEDLSMTYGQATSDMSKGMYDILSAAFDAEDALNLLTTATRASIAGLSDIRTSTDIFTTVLNTYGMQVEQATDVSNILFQSVIRGKFQFQDLEQALGYVVPIAAQAGIAFDELMAALSTATRHGLHLDMTSRGLALAIQGIVNPSSKAAKAADNYGIEMNGLALRVTGLHGWFEKLNEATQEYGKSILGELIPNMRSLRVAMVLAGDVGLAGFGEDIIKLVEMGDATNIALEKIMDTSAFVSNRLTQQWEQVKREVGEDWDDLVMNIQRGVLAIGQFFAGTKTISIAGEKYEFIEKDAIHNATEYLRIGEEIRKLEEKRDVTPEWDDPLKWTGWKGLKEDWRIMKGGEKKVSPFEQIDADLAALVALQPEFLDAFNESVGGILTEIDALGDLELTLGSVELAIKALDDELLKTFIYGFKDASGVMKEASIDISTLTTLTQDQRDALSKLGSTIQGNLSYQYLALHAQREYADATHDVTMGLKIAGYVYKEIPIDIQTAVNATREYTEAQDDNKEATQRMTAAMRVYQIQLLELQLKGMMRRRGLTRMEERQIKKIQILQAQARLDNMQGQKKMLEVDVTTNQTSQQLIDDYLLKIKEKQYELKYTYDQQITDLETLISREGEKLQTRYDWWETTNQKIITNSEGLITTLNEIMEEPLFVSMLDGYGLKVDDLKIKIQSLMDTASGRLGTYETDDEYVPSIVSPIAKTGASLKDLFESTGVPIPPTLQRFKRGTYNVPEDMIAMVHRNERIIPAGDSTKAGGTGDVFQISITVNAKVNTDYDIEKLGAAMGEAMETQILNKRGRSKYRMR